MAVSSYFGYAEAITLTDKDGDSLTITLNFDSDIMTEVPDGLGKTYMPLALMKLEYYDPEMNGTLVSAEDMEKLGKVFLGIAQAMKVAEA